MTEKTNLSPIKMKKQELREQVKARIRLMSREEREAASIHICQQIISTTEWQEAKTVWLYAALPDEVDLTLLIQNAEHSGKQILLPVVEGDNLQIRFYDPQHLSTKGKFNIQEPTSHCPTLNNPDEIDLAIIPGRAFTRDGWRMGRGKGYYDRILTSLRCPKWGVAFGCQMAEELPTDPWDIRLERIFWE